MGDLALIRDAQMRHDLELGGFGEESKRGFFLKPFESLYLLYSGKLKLVKSGRAVDFNALMQACKKNDGAILTKFLVYRDLRVRGYAVKDGFGFGSDFRVYERGRFGDKGAKYVVFGLNEGTQEKVGNLQKKIDQITRMGKEPIIAVVERRGEIIYYKISKIAFSQNKEDAENKIF